MLNLILLTKREGNIVDVLPFEDCSVEGYEVFDYYLRFM